jgi:hypothetical protein
VSDRYFVGYCFLQAPFMLMLMAGSNTPMILVYSRVQLRAFNIVLLRVIIGIVLAKFTFVVGMHIRLIIVEVTKTVIYVENFGRKR